MNPTPDGKCPKCHSDEIRYEKNDEKTAGSEKDYDYWFCDECGYQSEPE